MADEMPRRFARQDFEGLPPRAIVAFAARCARRVQPLFDTDDAEQSEPIDRAIRVAELHASGEEVELSKAARTTRNAVAVANKTHDGSGLGSYDVAYSAANAASSVRAAITNGDVATSTAVAAHSAWVACAYNTGLLPGEAMKFAHGLFARDLWMLRSYCAEQGWTEGSDVVVPPEFFGPMWPDGEPEGWPDLGPAAADQAVVLNLRIPPMEDTPENRAKLREHLLRVVNSTNELHMANGGSGLKVKDVKAYSAVDAAVLEPTDG